MLSEALVELNSRGEILDVRCHGVLSNGTRYETKPLPLDAEHGETTIGTLASEVQAPSDGGKLWWTKAQLDDDSFLLTTAKGYDVTNCLIKKESDGQ